jgi:CBS domain-containing protein
VITSKEEASAITFPNVVVASDPETTVNEAIRLLRNGAFRGCAVIGIDPGEEPGIAVLSNGIVEAVYRVPVGRAVGVIERIKQTYSDILVRIGHGARLASMRLANSLVAQGIPVELVDESGTSPYLGKGTSGTAISDIVAAINIAYTQGVRVGHQEILPSKGEIRWIQERSRELSDGRTTISRQLAKRVAIGEITIKEALTEHKRAKQNQTC